MTDMNDLHNLLSRMADDDPGEAGFTLHVMFTAKDLEQALIRGDQYAQALNLLRMEVDCYQARVSERGDWSGAVAIYCLAPGPDPADVCLRYAKHKGNHAGPGHSDVWTDAQIPTAPDTIEGLDSTGRDTASDTE